MKLAYVLAIASCAITARAFAQAPDANTSPGPHDPNPPMELPDLRLPAPCAPLPSIAAASAVAKPGKLPLSATSGQVLPVDSSGTQCSANTQSAELPGLAPAPQ